MRDGKGARGVFLVLLVTMHLLMIPSRPCMEPRSGPDGRVRVLYTGDPISTHLTPYMFMLVEPLVEVTPIIASEVVARNSFGIEGPDRIRRAIRLYMPRNYKQLVDSQDVVILSDSTLLAFRSDHLDWFARSVEEEGLGLMMAGGHESFHMGGWQNTVVADILPVDCLQDTTGSGFAEILDHENEFIESIPWEGLRLIGFGGSNLVRKKEWAKELANLKVTMGEDNPMMVVGDVGRGRSFAFTPDWTFGWGEAFSHWEYYGDFANNLMLYLAGQKVPQDIQLLHRARKELLRLDISRGLLISLFEFVESFGANPEPLEKMLDEVDRLRKEAEMAYIDQDFPVALEMIMEAMEEAALAEEGAIQVKKAVLFWVYLIEWLTVTATLMISGFIVWSLMVKRRYFKEVQSTRFGG